MYMKKKDFYSLTLLYLFAYNQKSNQSNDEDFLKQSRFLKLLYVLKQTLLGYLPIQVILHHQFSLFQSESIQSQNYF